MTSEADAITRAALLGALVAIACALVAFAAFLVNEATTTSGGMFAYEHVLQQSLMASVMFVGWLAFSAFAVSTKLARKGRRAFAVRAWMTLASVPFDAFAVFLLAFVKGWGSPTEGEIVSKHALVAYFLADLVASIFVVTGAIAGRRGTLSS